MIILVPTRSKILIEFYTTLNITTAYLKLEQVDLKLKRSKWG